MATTFSYKVKDKAGKLHDGEMQASSQAVVAKTLRDRGFMPVLVEEKKASSFQKEIRIPGLSGRVKVKEVAIFSRQFATMINSGLSLLRSLTILAEQTLNRAFRDVILDVKSSVEKGSSLSQALEKHPKVFPRLYTSMVKSGEVGGVLDETLERLALTLEAQVELRGQVKSAMMYPVAVFGLVIFIVIAMLLFVVPMFESMFADFGAELPLPTRMLMSLSVIFTTYWYLAVGGTIGLVYGFKRWIATDRGRSRFDAIKLKMPIFGKLVHKTALARFSHTMAALTRTGVPILMAMDIVAETSGNAVVARAVHSVQASVKEGESIAEPLSNHPVFPPMVVQMMAVGEETGALDIMLEKLGDFYDREVKVMVEGLTSLIEPLLVVILGATVGGMLLALYLPIFNVITLIE
ncbi:MAG TPA: type II secretion system F family protein [Acidimicrobiia bacterium]|nr:type II secretion system F family protein [Acidimicrobiia bacterium]